MKSRGTITYANSVDARKNKDRFQCLDTRIPNEKSTIDYHKQTKKTTQQKERKTMGQYMGISTWNNTGGLHLVFEYAKKSDLTLFAI